MSNITRISDIEIRLEELDKERRSLVAELEHLRAQKTSIEEMPAIFGTVTSNIPQSPEQKIELFLNLFTARSSVYPKLWENSQKGTKGYSPACKNEWVKELCGKPKIKCTDCPNQAFLKLDACAVKDHLQGKHTIGTYAICEDDSCRFLVADFDGQGWAADVLAYKSAGRELGIQIEIERSRSGNGAHAWIFFLDSIPARLARQLGTIIIARAQASRHAMSLETYDRFFPNQDYLPKGGFGNLIALPLQRAPRENNNSIFLDEKLDPIQDQWGHLAQVRRLSINNVQHILSQQSQDNSAQLIYFEDAAVASAEKALDAGRRKVVAGCYPGNVEIECGAQLSIKLSGLPSEIIAAFKRTATFANPKFFELERMRFSTWKTPRFIFCGEVQPDYLLLPRGSLDACLEIVKKAGSSVVLRNVKPQFKKIKATFSGELSLSQKKAVSQICAHEIGVLVAPPGAGKTVMGCNIIAKRKVPTLVLVHRMPLLEQWKMQISTFLGIEIKKIGTLGGQKKKQTGQIDIAMLQTLSNIQDPEEALSGYGQIIIDECHHIPAVTFEAILKKCSPKFVLGLTATPYRKDGHQAIIHMQCGPVRHEIKHFDGPILNKKVIVRETTFKMPEEFGQQPAIHLVWENLVTDKARLDLIAQDLRSSLEEKRFPLIISERKEHLEMLSQVFKEKLSNLNVRSFTLTGGLGKKTRAAI